MSMYGPEAALGYGGGGDEDVRYGRGRGGPADVQTRAGCSAQPAPPCRLLCPAHAVRPRALAGSRTMLAVLDLRAESGSSGRRRRLGDAALPISAQVRVVPGVCVLGSRR